MEALEHLESVRVSSYPREMEFTTMKSLKILSTTAALALLVAAPSASFAQQGHRGGHAAGGAAISGGGGARMGGGAPGARFGGAARRTVEEVAPSAWRLAEAIGDKQRAFRASMLALDALPALGASSADSRPEWLEASAVATR